jgi:hypothetical protein
MHRRISFDEILFFNDMKKGSIIIFIIVGLIFFCSSVNAENTVDYIILDGPHSERTIAKNLD